MTIKKFNSCNISGFKLILSCVGTGNVGQLAADLFIESVQMKKLAMVWNPAIIPMLGPEAFNAESTDTSTASEMFVSEKDKMVFVQTRTPLTASLLDGYISEIVQFIQQEKIVELIILTSSYSHEQHFIGKNPFEFVANSHMQQKTFAGFSEAPTDFAISGSGYARQLLKAATESEIPTVILFKYTSEGDNFMDGIQLCQKVNEHLQIIPSTNEKLQIKTPISWKFFFGRNVNPEIY